MGGHYLSGIYGGDTLGALVITSVVGLVVLFNIKNQLNTIY